MSQAVASNFLKYAYFESNVKVVEKPNRDHADASYTDKYQGQCYDSEKGLKLPFKY